MAWHRTTKRETTQHGCPMILSAQTIRKLGIISPFSERTKSNGMTYGLSAAGYDVRIAQTKEILAGTFTLASTIEYFTMPNNVLGMVKDKSTWARQGIVVQNTVIEPGWRGYLTLEISNHSDKHRIILRDSPIAQIVFQFLDEPTEQPYDGKYQNQADHPVEAIHEI